MFKRARYFRWAILLITLVVEALAFWFGGPESAPGSTLAQAIILKLQHPMSWIWVGWASLSMAWFWAEFAFSFYSHGRRTRAVLKRSHHEKLIYDTGVHWLVLLRDIHINQLCDGEKEKLEENLFPREHKRSFAWHAIWWPVLLAISTTIYFVGWVAWAIRSVPQSSQSWSLVLQEKTRDVFIGPLSSFAEPVGQLLITLPHWLEVIYGTARENAFITISIITGIWLVMGFFSRRTKKIPVVSGLLRFGVRLSILVGVFALLSTKLFDWLTPVYDLVPNHALVAVGFIPLTLASAFYFPHILFWSSWRYAIIRDEETYDATLMTLGGVFNSLQQRINLQRIVDTDIRQWWWQRVFDVGDIELKEMGGGEAEKVRHIFGPHRMLDEIRSAIREGKMRPGHQSEFDDVDNLDAL